jgi:hypothetical protein
MRKHRFLIAAASAALVLGAASFSADAIEVNVGGTKVGTGSAKGGGTTLSIGGSGGVSVKATVGGSNSIAKGTAKAGNISATAKVGGTNNIARGVVNAGGDKARVSVGTAGTGPLAKVDSTGNLLSGNSLTSADVDLGGLLGSLGAGSIIGDLPGIGGGGTGGGGSGGSGGGGSGGGGLGGGGGGGGGGGVITPGKVKVIAAGMSSGERAQMKITCRGVLSNPMGYDPNLIRLCRLLARL